MKIHYLEVVTPEVDAACKMYAQLHNVTFEKSDPALGGARVASLANGGIIGIRPPLRDTETPIVRHYMLVEDIQAAVDTAQQSGATIAVPPIELPGHGLCAIIIHHGIESGFWQL